MRMAFTLAEVLITLGIISVVAALTLPAVINNIKEKQYETAMKKGYSVLSQALARMNEEQGFIANQENYGGDKFAPVFKNYLNLLKDCGQEDCEALGKDDDGVLDLLSEVYKTYNGSSDAWNALFDEGQFMLSDGMFVLIDNDGVRPIIISIDVNGYTKNLINGDMIYLRFKFLMIRERLCLWEQREHIMLMKIFIVQKLQLII